MTSLDILRRRRLIFQYWSQNITNGVTIQGLLRGQGIEVSQETVRKDLRTMDEWLPEFVMFERDSEKSREATAQMLARVRLAQDRMSQLAFSAKGANAQVGAARTLLDAVRQEADLRARLGQIAPHTTREETEVNMNAVSDEDIARYVPVIVKLAMEKEVRTLDIDDDQTDSEEPVD